MLDAFDNELRRGMVRPLRAMAIGAYQLAGAAHDLHGITLETIDRTVFDVMPGDYRHQALSVYGQDEGGTFWQKAGGRAGSFGKFVSTIQFWEDLGQYASDSTPENAAKMHDSSVALVPIAFLRGARTPAASARPSFYNVTDYGIELGELGTRTGAETVAPSTRAVPVGEPSNLTYRHPTTGRPYATVEEIIADFRVQQRINSGRLLEAPSKPAGARGFDVHQDVVGQYVREGGTDLGFTHRTTDVRIGSPGSPQVSIVSADLGSPSYSRVVSPGRQHPLTGVLKQKAWKSATDAQAGTPRIVHVESYGPQPTAAQRAAIKAAQDAASRYTPPVQIIWRHRP
jgi:hypothetical protein